MRRLVIIDHDDHTLFVEDVPDHVLEKYGGDEQAYIDENYDIENFSWDWVTDSRYIPYEDPYPFEIDFGKSIR